MATERYYFHLLDGRRVGPLGLDILQRMAESGEIGPKARLKRESDGRRFRASQKLRFDVQDEKREEKRTTTASEKSDGRDAFSKANVGTARFGDASPRKNGSERPNDAEVASADVFNPFWELTRGSDVGDKSVAVLGTRSDKRSDKMFYVYDVLDRRRGPYSVVDLKRLVVEGQIARNTTLETLLGKRGRAGDMRELTPFFQTDATDDSEKLDCSQIFLIVFLCVFGTILAIGGIVWALTHPALLGRLLIGLALLVPALGAAWYIGKAAWAHIGVILKTTGCLLALGVAVAFCVALWKLCGWWLLLAPAVVFVLLLLGLIVGAGADGSTGTSSGVGAYKPSKETKESLGGWSLWFSLPSWDDFEGE